MSCHTVCGMVAPMKTFIKENCVGFKKTNEKWGMKKDGNSFIGSNLLGEKLVELRKLKKLTQNSRSTPAQRQTLM
jgi:hypothetical protein